jgi:predicted transport protein
MFVQGLFYLDWLKKNKRHFDLLVADKLGKDVKVNWLNPRVVLIAQGFDNRTMIAVKQVDNVELMKYLPYKNSILYLENVYIPGSEKRIRQRVSSKKEAKKDDFYDIEYHFKKGNSTDDIKNIFYKLQDKIKSLPEVEEVTNQKSGITYKTTKSFVRLEFRKTLIDVLVRSPKYDDPKKIVIDISTHMWGYKGRIKLKKENEVDDVFEIIKQSYEETL